MGFFMHVDVLIVGFGLAGWATTASLEKANKSFLVFEAPQAAASSRAATGIYNPTVLKRFRAIDQAKTLMQHSIAAYKQSDGILFNHSTNILRILASIAEQNDWAVAADRPELALFLAPNITHMYNKHVRAPYGVGRVLHTGWIDIPAMLDAAQANLMETERLRQACFDYASLQFTPTGVAYKGITSDYVIFTEGIGMNANSWFSSLPLLPNKGEWLIVSCPGLEEKRILKGSVFIVPLGGDTYRIGATYSKDFSSVDPTDSARDWLEKQFRKYVKLPYTVLSHGAGLRPTTPDRKPLIGQHPTHPALACINGLGSRGVLWAPYAANLLINALFYGEKIPEALDLNRFMAKNAAF